MSAPGTIYSVTEYRVQCLDCRRTEHAWESLTDMSKRAAIACLRRLGWRPGWDDRWRCGLCARRYEEAHAGMEVHP